jgi:RNA polymerase sigma factor (sigma-70 family)
MNFEELTYRMKDKLLRFSGRIMGNIPEAEDVVQEVFLKIWEKRDTMQDVLNPDAYCMTLTKNLSLDKLRSKHRRTEDIDNAISVTHSELTPYAAIETQDTIGKIREYMNALPEKQKLVMHLRDIEGMSYDEIAVQLDMPMPQVKVYLHRARNTVREKMMTIS